MENLSDTDYLVFAAAPGENIPHRYSMQAKGNSEAEILLYGDIGDPWFGGVTAKQFADDLKALGKVDTIHLRINSYGGDVFQGLTIYRILIDHPAKIIAHVDGVAASIASVIAMAATEINISEAGFIMIHNAWGVAIGNEGDMLTMAALLKKTTTSLRDVYVARTSNTADKVKKWMDDETWFTSDEAVANGFADKVSDNMRIAARVDLSKHRFKRPPAALADTPNADLMRQRIARMKNKHARSASAA
ncbi:ATP-dependent Clp protease, proteolytic subunit ClpP [Neorhizobium galegae bv. officinalis bv. officinalis str. HAMBI 1141]|uniref:ATP-dependent Clp protease proteolytic subunit n=1 Tax=Neorhizobium galegae bv. officinalis bv. officinalis str. HAMBI 1141 TaxID=1028801 RepID=A0A068T246_NEOGA|nr:head maturation protease, ClpP-related [Neorhizobium galegae]CDN52527.1 ATP-dependent Clp protease, proteolytic subunit ClpP [Neorhizobium galegae bv. officinalis bv. officinalis str. HAMBI 1141]